MTTAQVYLPEKLIPVFEGRADVRGAHGGRGSGKTRSFAKMAAVWGYKFGHEGQKGLILCARQFMNSLADSSLEECKRAIEDEPFLLEYYDIGQNYIKSKDGAIEFVFAGLDRNINSVKSKGRILLCWVDEAEPVTETAFNTLEPTLREEGTDWNAELWLTWNPLRKKAAVEQFRKSTNPLTKIVEINWRDNKKFPLVLERKRLDCLINKPDHYPHIWEGAYATTIEGAYFAKALTKAKQDRRIGRVGADELLSYRVYVDIGGTGKNADAFSMWVAQFVGREIRVLDYYEAVGQQLGDHVGWLRNRCYTPDKAKIWLPHDGATHDKVVDISYESALSNIGYDVTVVKNQGAGAAQARIMQAQGIFPICWFNEETTQAGREALGFYHEKRDANRDIGLGPEHDWSSHAADAFGLMAICYEPPRSSENSRFFEEYDASFVI
jgi:phage terminase large subunit